MVFSSEISSAKEAGSFLQALTDLAGEKIGTWADAVRVLTVAETRTPMPAEPTFRALVEDAIALKDASLVIFRDRTLVEFKTDELGGLYEYKEGDHTSWQIGETKSHHCHLSLNAVTRVEFSA
ncbi:MAG: hypothetical protein AAF206_21085, partial [Bacteroidota bacterium]